ncbi:unnamed protein product [Penicillium olsonii]|nr:unnamed protein product [Penicillium olsonii]
MNITKPVSNCPAPARLPLLAQRTPRLSRVSDVTNVIPDQVNSQCEDQSVADPVHAKTVSQVNAPAEDGYQRVNLEVTSDGGAALPASKDVSKPSGNKTSFPLPPESKQEPQPQRRPQAITSLPRSRVPLRPVNTQLASKRVDPVEKEAPQSKLLPNPTGKRIIQLSENDLFEQLIVKIRQREESEQNTASIIRQIESENQALKETNQNLQERVRKQQGQLAKASSENKGQRAQLDQWRAKIVMFKGIIGELGREYDKVREQTMSLKETAVSLGDEKSQIQATLEDLKMQVSRHTETAEGQKKKLATSDGAIAHLTDALNHSEKRGDLIKSQLVGERKRIVTLETYIQNESQTQARYLYVVKKEQGRMTEKLDAMCDQFSKACLGTQDVILSKLSPEVERCVASVEDMKKQHSAETLDAEHFAKNIEEAASRFGSLAGQFASDLDRNNEMSNSVAEALREGLQSVESNLGPYSSLVKQLAHNENCYNSLQQQVQAVTPSLGSLGALVKTVEATETELIGALQNFGQMLSAARIPAGNPVLEKELTAKFSENTQLQLRLQQISSEIDSLRMQVSSKASEVMQLQSKLKESMNNEQEHRGQVSRCEIEKTALRGELVILEQRIREELTIAARTSQDDMREKFEHEVRDLETINIRLEHDLKNLKTQLSDAQTLLRQESQAQIEDLTKACSEYVLKEKAIEVELQMTKASENKFHSEKEMAKELLDQANRKAHRLEAQLELKTQSESMMEKAKQEAEKAFVLLELEATRKSEEMQSMKQAISLLESRSAALEKIGGEADAEIVSLLQRAQEAESWQVTMREGLAKIMEIHPDEPFELTWQRIENALKLSVTQRTMDNTLCTSVEQNDEVETERKGNDAEGLKKRDAEAEFANELAERLRDASERVPLVQSLPPSVCDAPKSFEHDNCVDPRHMLPIDHGHIVPFSSLHEKIAAEGDDFSLFNDTAELEMLMLSTPDLQGPFASSQRAPCDRLKDAPKAPETSDKGNEVAKEADSVVDSANIEKSQLVHHGEPRGKISYDCPKIKEVNARRKVVSFEGSRLSSQAEVKGTRRLSDATDDSSGRDSESKETKRTHKRTYSRLSQSVVQDENHTDENTELQPSIKDPTTNPRQGSTITDEDPGAPCKPPKRSRKTGVEPERRLSPKGLASGSSKSNAVSTSTNLRARAKRRSRGKVSHFSV